MKSIYLWFYCLSMWEASLVLFCGAVGYLYLRERLSSRTWWKACICFFLVVWLGAVFWVTLANRGADPSGQQLLLLPFRDYPHALRSWSWEYLRDDFMNVALFFPGGLFLSGLLPERWTLGRRLALVAVGNCAVSLGIEITQYFWCLGLAEMDDVIHNTLGSVLGFWSSRIPIQIVSSKE